MTLNGSFETLSCVCVVSAATRRGVLSVRSHAGAICSIPLLTTAHTAVRISRVVVCIQAGRIMDVAHVAVTHTHPDSAERERANVLLKYYVYYVCLW